MNTCSCFLFLLHQLVSKFIINYTFYHLIERGAGPLGPHPGSATVIWTSRLLTCVSVCLGSGTLTAVSGTLQSPGYPSVYPGNVKCSWKIVAPSGHIIQLAIKEIDLENCYSCRCDSVQMFDGETWHGRSLGRACGTTHRTVSSTGRFMYVTFSTNVYKAGLGFNASYSMTKDEKIPSVCNCNT